MYREVMAGSGKHWSGPTDKCYRTPLCLAAITGVKIGPYSINWFSLHMVCGVLSVFTTGQSVRPEGRTRTDYES